MARIGKGLSGTPCRVAASIVLALLLLVSFSYLNSLENLVYGSAVSRIGARALDDSPLQQIMAISEGVPPFSLLLILLVPPFCYRNLRIPTRRDLPIVIVACVLSLLTIGMFAITRTQSLAVLVSTTLCAVLSIVSLASLAAFAFVLISSAFRWLEAHTPHDGGSGGDGPDRAGKEDTLGTDATPGCEESSASAIANGQACAQARRSLSPWGWFGVGTGAIVLGWLPCIIAFFPGSVCYDVAFQLAQVDGLIPFNAEHPVFSTLLYGGIFHLGESIAGPDAGVFAIVLMQTIAMSAAFGLEIGLMARLGAPKWALVLCAAFFALVPTFGVSAQWCMKDALFCSLFCVYATLIVMCARMRERFLASPRWMTLLALVAVACGLLRSNGLIVIGLSLPFLCLLTKGMRARIASLVPAIIVIVLIPAITLSLNTLVGVAEESKANMLSAPLQQIARVVALEDDLTDAERAFVDAGLGGTDAVREAYEPELSDGVKTLYKEHGSSVSSADLLGTWASIGARHPGAYLDSMAHMTYGYLSVVAFPAYENAIAFFTQPGGDLFGYSFAFPEEVRDEAAYASVALQDFPGLGVLGQPGLYTWLLLLDLAYLAWIGRGRQAVVLLPALVLVLTILVGPVNGSIRYFLPIMGAAPIMLWHVVSLAPDTRGHAGTG